MGFVGMVEVVVVVDSGTVVDVDVDEVVVVDVDEVVVLVLVDVVVDDPDREAHDSVEV